MKWNTVYMSEDGKALIQKETSIDRRKTITTWSLNIRAHPSLPFSYVGIDDDTLAEAKDRYERMVKR